MVHVEGVDLSQLDVRLPSDRVGMVIAQPHLSLTAVEPFRCVAESKQQQLSVLTDTLAVARTAHHGVPKTHFTLFPEYSIPAPEGIALIDAALASNDWPNGTIVIGGTDALTKAEYASLAASPGTHFDAAHSSPDMVGETSWVNCAIVWVKANNGTVERWLQPKVHPCWVELNIHYQHMFRGTSVYVFRGLFANDTPFRFCTLICFDWIATVANQKIWRWILTELQQ